jgi:hypothetical protein
MPDAVIDGRGVIEAKTTYRVETADPRVAKGRDRPRREVQRCP